MSFQWISSWTTSRPLFPYVEAPSLELLGFPIEAFGLLAWLSLAVGIVAFQRRVARLERIGRLESAAANRALGAGLLGAFALSHAVYLLAYLPSGVDVSAGLAVDLAGGMSSLGGLLGLLAGTAIWARFTGRPALAWLDAVIWAAAHGWIVARLGCALAHDHLGRFSDSWLAIRWPPHLSQELNPEGFAGRYDLGLLEALLAVGLVVALRLLDRAGPRFPGSSLCLVCTLYAPLRFLMDFLRTGEPEIGGLTPAQYLCLIVLAVGCGAWLRGRRPGARPLKMLPKILKAQPRSPVAGLAMRSAARPRAVLVGLLGMATLVGWLAPSPASASEPALPAGWEGDWTWTVSYTDAGRATPHLVEHVTDSICPGDTLGVDRFTPLVGCSQQTVDDSSIHLSCAGEVRIAGCWFQGALSLDLLRSSDSLSGSASIDTSHSGLCPAEPFGQEIVIVGTRHETTPSDCSAPASLVDRFIFLPDLAALERIVEIAPTAEAGGPYAVPEGQSVVLDGSRSSDPDQPTDSLSVEWDLDGDAIFGEIGDAAARGNEVGISPTFSAAGLDGPTTAVVSLRVTDSGAVGDRDTATVHTSNVAPTVATVTATPEPSHEGGPVTASASFTDPAGSSDAPFTCTVDYGAGPESGIVSSSVSGLTCTGPSFVYGDDGAFSVTVAVSDKDGDAGSQSAEHPVRNLPPTVVLETTEGVRLPGGRAFLGRQGVEQEHGAEAEDSGSDDLTFVWDFVVSTLSSTHFNDTGDSAGTPDPFPSPGGVFPFSASDTATVVYADPGLYQVRLDVEDDDAGVDSDRLAKLVTGDSECTRGQGFWRRQFRLEDDTDSDSDSDSDSGRRSSPRFDVATLQAFLDVIDFASSVFSELEPAFDFETAQELLASGGGRRSKATRQTLAAWLNFASGAVGVEEPIDLEGRSDSDSDGDSDSDSDRYRAGPTATFLEVIGVIESILLDPLASRADLILAKDLAEAVNHLSDDVRFCRK